MIRMPFVIIMIITRMMAVDTKAEIVGITTKESTSSVMKTANVAAVKASAAATMANAGIITPKVSAGMGTVIRIDV